MLKFGHKNANDFQLFSQRTLGSFSEAIPFLIGVLLVGSLNSNLFCGSRYMYAAAKQGKSAPAAGGKTISGVRALHFTACSAHSECACSMHGMQA